MVFPRILLLTLCLATVSNAQGVSDATPALCDVGEDQVGCLADAGLAVCAAGASTEGAFAVCGVRAGCHQAIWGYHDDDAAVGGHNGCTAGVWLTPDPSDDVAIEQGRLCSIGSDTISCDSGGFTCRTHAAPDDGPVGVDCRRDGACPDVYWGYHSDELTVGGNDGCNVKVLVGS